MAERKQSCGWIEIHCTCYIPDDGCSYPVRGHCLIYNYAVSVFGHKKNEMLNLLNRMQNGWERERRNEE